MVLPLPSIVIVIGLLKSILLVTVYVPLFSVIVVSSVAEFISLSRVSHELTAVSFFRLFLVFIKFVSDSCFLFIFSTVLGSSMYTLCFSCTATSLTTGASVLILSDISVLMPSVFVSAAFAAPTSSISNVTSSRIIDFPFMLNHSMYFF